MYLCNCKGIKVSQFRIFLEQEKNAKQDLDATELVGKFSLVAGLGTGCGKCVKEAHDTTKPYIQDVADELIGS